MKPKDLRSEQWDSFLEGLALGHYALILGAGASVSSVNSAGDPLPTGGQLRDLLAANYALPGTGDLSLRRTYDLCDQIAQSRGPATACGLSRSDLRRLLSTRLVREPRADPLATHLDSQYRRRPGERLRRSILKAVLSVTPPKLLEGSVDGS